MSTKPNLLRGPALWTLIAGVAIGAGSMYSVVAGHNTGSLAMAQTQLATARPAAITSTESTAALKALDTGFATLAEYASPAVVLIKSENKAPSAGQSELLSTPRVMGGEGSGVIFRPDGYIVTNDHVVGGFDKVTVVLKDGREFPGKVTRAEDSDIAVVKIDASGLPTLSFADSSKTRPGEFAMAIGAPYGLENSVTIGHVSAINRTNRIPDPISGTIRNYPELIQTDAAINMGNSGGPLINVDGQVIGINSSIISPPGGNGGGVGLGFAISSNQARLIAETLIEKGSVKRAFLGLVPLDLKDVQKSEFHVSGGAYVEEVPSDGPAGIAGIKPKDIVVRIGSLPVTDQIDLRNAMLKYAPGTTVDVEVVREGQHKVLQVKLVEPPKDIDRFQQQPRIDNQMPNPYRFGPNGDMPDVREWMKQFENGRGNPDRSEAPKGAHPQLGVQVHDIDDTARKQFHIPNGVSGAVVAAVIPGLTADKMGLKPGDVIQSLGDKEVHSSTDLVSAMSAVSWGDTTVLGFTRYGDGNVHKQSQTVTFK